MRFSVHLCQRKFLNKHSSFSHHVFHVSFIPSLVSVSFEELNWKCPDMTNTRHISRILVYSGITMFKEYETEKPCTLLSTCTSPTDNLYVSSNHYQNSEYTFLPLPVCRPYTHRTLEKERFQIVMKKLKSQEDVVVLLMFLPS